MPPSASSYSYLFRDPFGISTRQRSATSRRISARAARSGPHDQGVPRVHPARQRRRPGRGRRHRGGLRRASSTAFVADFVTPLIAAIGGKPDFARLTLHDQRLARSATATSSTRSDHVPDRRRGDLLLRRQAAQRARGAAQAARPRRAARRPPRTSACSARSATCWLRATRRRARRSRPRHRRRCRSPRPCWRCCAGCGPWPRRRARARPARARASRRRGRTRSRRR